MIKTECWKYIVFNATKVTHAMQKQCQEKNSKDQKEGQEEKKRSQ